jgi:outer membrane protein assembly factor BamB
VLVARNIDSGEEVWRVPMRVFGVGDRPDRTRLRGTAQGVIVLATERGRLSAVDLASGATKWTTDGGGYISDTSALALVASPAEPSPHMVVALDRSTGLERWRFDAPDGRTIQYPPVTDSGVVVVTLGTTEGRAEPRVVGLEEATGRLLWEKPFGPSSDNDILVGDGAVVGGSGALDVRTGKALWSFDTARPAQALPVADGNVYAVEPPRLRVLSAQEGTLRWETDLRAVAAGDGVLIAASSDAEMPLRALDAATGGERWRSNLPREAWLNSANPAITNGYLLVGGNACGD